MSYRDPSFLCFYYECCDGTRVRQNKVSPRDTTKRYKLIQVIFSLHENFVLSAQRVETLTLNPQTKNQFSVNISVEFPINNTAAHIHEFIHKMID